MRRRAFLSLVGGAAAAWPLAARGEQGPRSRHIGVLLPAPMNDPDYQPWMSAFPQALDELGWIDGRNVHIEQLVINAKTAQALGLNVPGNLQQIADEVIE